VRDALFASLADIGGPQAAEFVARSLRSEDAAIRGGAVEALKSLGDDAVDILDLLLDDGDADVRILAVEVTRVWPDATALPRLRHVLEHDPHVNACAAAVDVATEVGTIELLPALQGLRSRFPAEPFLAFAADIACSRISGDDGRAI
jgi:HEAT repeat protein